MPSFTLYYYCCKYIIGIYKIQISYIILCDVNDWTNLIKYLSNIIKYKYNLKFCIEMIFVGFSITTFRTFQQNNNIMWFGDMSLPIVNIK